jgi:2-furoyl-CoA dehydrogenase FAD binding subunit
VKAAPFRYERPRGLKQALELLRSEDSKAIAGGQSLVPMMAMRLARPRVLVDLGAVAGLDAIEERDGALVTGAMVRQRALERHPGIAHRLPLVAAALPFVGHREIRSRGTVGGSLAHADPAAELGIVAATLRATIIAEGSDGKREIAGDELVRGPLQTALRSDELLTAVHWPASQPGDGFAFAEVARRHGDFALCGVAAHVRRHGGEIVVARVGLLGVGPVPIVRELAESIGGDAQPREVAAEIAREIEPPGDMHASAGYRRRLVRVLVERCIRRALEHAGTP